MNNKQVCNLISKLNDGNKRNLTYIDILSNKNILKILTLLLRTGFIHKFVKCPLNPDTHIRVFLKSKFILSPQSSPQFSSAHTTYSKIYRSFRRIELVSHGSYNIYLSYKKVKKDYLNYLIIYVFSTKHGLKTSFEVVDLKMGGKLLFKIIL